MSQDLVIQKLDRAKQALAEARTIQQTKKVLDVAAAMKIYSTRQKLGQEAIAYATSVEVLALIQLGEYMAATPKATGGQHGGKTRIDGSRKDPSNKAKTMDEQGVDKHTADLARKARALSPEDKAKAIEGKTTIARATKEKKRKRHVQDLAKTAAVSPALPVGRFDVSQPGRDALQDTHNRILLRSCDRPLAYLWGRTHYLRSPRIVSNLSN